MRDGNFLVIEQGEQMININGLDQQATAIRLYHFRHQHAVGRTGQWRRRNLRRLESVSYTHLTLPTTPYVLIAAFCVVLKEKAY